jgi:hypothetical protein
MTTYKWVRDNLNNNVYKYYFTNSSQDRLSWREVLELVNDKDTEFLKIAKKALDDANNKAFPYRWNCSPISKTGLDKSFEFVVKKESGLIKNNQDYASYETYINDSSNPHVCSFPSRNGNIMTIPMPVSGKNFSSISYFTQNASSDQQANFWQKVSIELTKEINRSGETKWLNTHGSGVSYLHVRIDKSPTYYFFEDYKKPDYTPIPTPQTPEEKLLVNLDKIVIDPFGFLANAELLKNESYHNKSDYSRTSQLTETYQVEIEGETINLHTQLNESELIMIKKAKIANIISNQTNWKIEKEGSVEILTNNSGAKCWKWGFSQDEWKKIENSLKNSPNKKDSETDKKWYNPADYPLPWIAVLFSVILIAVIDSRKRNKRKF